MKNPDDERPATRGDIMRLRRHIERAFNRTCSRLVRSIEAKLDTLAEAVASRGVDADRIMAKLEEIDRKLDAWRGLDPADAPAKSDSLH